MWSKAKRKATLEAKALLRRGVSSKAEEAALLYARLEGWTEEDAVDSGATESALNALLDGMEEEDFEGLKKVAHDVGDATFKGVLTYAVARIGRLNAAALEELRRE